MKTVSIGGLVVMAAMIAHPAWATDAPAKAEPEKTPEQLCQEYAQEDGVPADNLQTYIAECVASLSAVETESQSEGKKME